MHLIKLSSFIINIVTVKKQNLISSRDLIDIIMVLSVVDDKLTILSTVYCNKVILKAI